jgi:hypothetical protein
LIGFNQEKLGNKKAALQSYKTALSLDPNLTLAKEGIQSIN